MPSDDAPATLGARIRSRRKTLGWTLDRLAAESGLSKTFLWQLEHDESDPSLTSSVKLGDALGVPLEWLARGRDAGPRVDHRKVRALLARIDAMLSPPTEAPR
jgi:transcriptional regulator with XRE-family HTH domain